MDLENIMLSEKSQTQNVTYYMVPFISNVQNRQICRDRKGINLVQGCGFRVGVRFWGRNGEQLTGRGLLWRVTAVL